MNTPVYLYKVTNLVNEKVYIGITRKPKTRKWSHLNSNTSFRLSNAVKKYGKENFEFSLLCVGVEAFIIDLEEKAIVLYDSILNGYNTLAGNPRTGSLSLPDSVKGKISEALLDHYRNNTSKNKGKTHTFRTDDEFICVSGFWFPNARTAIKALNINKKTLYKWKKTNHLASEIHISSIDVFSSEQYVGGFWFPNIYTASIKLDRSGKLLKERIRRGTVEQRIKNTDSAKAGLATYMATRPKPDRYKAVIILGVRYETIKEAAQLSGYGVSKIKTRLKNKTDGFEYADAS